MFINTQKLCCKNAKRASSQACLRRLHGFWLILYAQPIAQEKETLIPQLLEKNSKTWIITFWHEYVESFSEISALLLQ